MPAPLPTGPATARSTESRVAWHVARLLSVAFTGTLASSLFSFAAQLLLARLLLPEDLGRLVALLAVVNFFTPIAGAGVNWFLLQAFGREGWKALRWLPSAGRLVALLTSLSAAGLAAYSARTFAPFAGIAAVAAIAVLLGQVMVELASARLQLTGRYGALAVWQASTQAGRLTVTGIAAFFPSLQVEAVLGGYAAVGLLTALAGVGLLAGLWRGRIELSGHGRLEYSIAEVRSVAATAREAGPFALVTMFYVLYVQGGVVLLEYLANGQDAAQYNAAFLVISAICLVPSVIYQKLLVAPLFRWAVHDRPAFLAAFHLGVVAMAILGCGFMLMVLVSAGWLIQLLFGGRYAGAGPVLALLSVSLPIRFLQSAYSSLFVSREDTARKARYLGIAALVAVAVGLLLIPPFGVAGAGTATILAEAALLILHVRGAARHVGDVSLKEGLTSVNLRQALARLATEVRDACV